MFTKLHFLTAYSLWLIAAYAQDVQILELSTSEVHPLIARIGNTCLIQLPVEPIGTNVGDPQMWLVEKSERIVSIKPLQVSARDTNLAVITRQGMLNFLVHLAPDSENFTQTIRVTRIVDDSKPLPSQQSNSQQTLADIIIHEIRVAQNYYALKLAGSPELREVEQFTQLHETGTKTYSCNLLQTFRFRDTRHLILHFVTENKSEVPISFDQCRTIINIGDTLFTPMAVSLGKISLQPKGSAENFIVLDGSNGLSHRQEFNIMLAETVSN